MNSIKNLGEELKKLQIDTEKIAGQYVPVINDAKKTLMVAIRGETSEQLPEISSFEDVSTLRDRTKKLLSRLGDTSGSHSRTIHSFFPRYAKVLKLQLGLLNREVGNLNQLIERYTEKTSTLSECSSSISRVSSALQERVDLVRKNAELNEELEALRARESELVKRLDDLQSKESFQQYRADKEDLARVKRDADALLSEIHTAFSRISRPLSKYTYEVGLDKVSNNLIQSIMKDPLNLIRDASVEQLMETLSKVREAVKGGKVVVKNPEKDVENITMLMNNIGQYIDAYEGYHSKMRGLSAKTSPVDMDLGRLRHELDRIKNDIVRKESVLDEFSGKLLQTSSAISSELRRIEERIEEATNSRVKINI